MVVGMWDPGAYLRFGTERARPFFDLVSQVRAEAPGFVADLGCGPGNLTAALAARWPAARVLGVDSSPEMIEAAQAEAGERLSFELADLRTWQPDQPIDVITCNAVLQWIPAPRPPPPGWGPCPPPGGGLPSRVRATSPRRSHTILRELASTPRW